MISAFCDVEYRVKSRSLSGGCEHCCGAAFQFADLLCYQIICGILQTAVEISV